MAKTKYKVRQVRRDAVKGPTGKAAMGRGKLLLLLLAGTLAASAIYFACVRARISFVFHLYWIASGVLVCLAAFLKYSNEAYIAVCKRKNGGILSDEDNEKCQSRDKTLKIVLLILIPLLLTVFGDAIYLLFLSDKEWFGALIHSV